LGPDFLYHGHNLSMDSPEPVGLYYNTYKPGDCCGGPRAVPSQTMLSPIRKRSCSMNAPRFRTMLPQPQQILRTSPAAPNYPCPMRPRQQAPPCPMVPRPPQALHPMEPRIPLASYCPDALCITRGALKQQEQCGKEQQACNRGRQNEPTQWNVTNWDLPPPEFLSKPKCEYPCVQRGQLKSGCPVPVSCPRPPYNLALPLPPPYCPPRVVPPPPPYFNRYSFFTHAPVQQYQRNPPAQFPSVPCYAQRRDRTPQVFPFFNCSPPQEPKDTRPIYNYKCLMDE